MISTSKKALPHIEKEQSANTDAIKVVQSEASPVRSGYERQPETLRHNMRTTDAGRVRHRHAKHAEAGAGLVEYALLIILIAMVGIVSIKTLGQEVGLLFGRSAQKIGQTFID